MCEILKIGVRNSYTVRVCTLCNVHATISQARGTVPWHKFLKHPVFEKLLDSEKDERIFPDNV